MERFHEVVAALYAKHTKPLKSALNSYESALNNNDSKAAVDAYLSYENNRSAAYKKYFKNRFNSLNSRYKQQFGADAGTIVYNSQKGEAMIDSSDKQNAGSNNTRAQEDNATMLTRGSDSDSVVTRNKKGKTLLGGM